MASTDSAMFANTTAAMNALSNPKKTNSGWKSLCLTEAGQYSDEDVRLLDVLDEEEFKRLEKAAYEGNDPFAQFDLAMYYHLNCGPHSKELTKEQRDKKALELVFKAAIEHQLPAAKWTLAEFYEEPSLSPDLIEQTNKYLAPNLKISPINEKRFRFEKAFDLLVEAAYGTNQGDIHYPGSVDAQFVLYLSYNEENDLIPAKDAPQKNNDINRTIFRSVQEKFWCKMAADNGKAEAQYRYSQNVLDSRETLKYLTLSAKQNYDPAIKAIKNSKYKHLVDAEFLSSLKPSKPKRKKSKLELRALLIAKLGSSSSQAAAPMITLSEGKVEAERQPEAVPLQIDASMEEQEISVPQSQEAACDASNTSDTSDGQVPQLVAKFERNNLRMDESQNKMSQQMQNALSLNSELSITYSILCKQFASIKEKISTIEGLNVKLKEMHPKERMERLPAMKQINHPSATLATLEESMALSLQKTGIKEKLAETQAIQEKMKGFLEKILSRIKQLQMATSQSLEQFQNFILTSSHNYLKQLSEMELNLQKQIDNAILNPSSETTHVFTPHFQMGSGSSQASSPHTPAASTQGANGGNGHGARNAPNGKRKAIEIDVDETQEADAERRGGQNKRQRT